MAVTLTGDLKVYEAQFNAGLLEGLYENIALVNAGTRNTIVMMDERVKGSYEYNAFYQRISSVVARRDPATDSSITAKKIAQSENVGVKVHRRFGPVQYTPGAIEMADDANPEATAARLLGRLLAEEKLKEQVSAAILCLDTALGGDNDYDGSAATMSHGTLNSGNAVMGDLSGNIANYIGHSKVWHDLMGQGITDNILDVTGMVLRQGMIPSMGRPFTITDNANLLNATPAPDEYSTLALVPGAITLKNSATERAVARWITGQDNLVIEFQAEWSYNISLLGYTWDVANGGANPSDAALGTATNWDLTASDAKGTGGVRIRTQ